MDHPYLVYSFKGYSPDRSCNEHLHSVAVGQEIDHAGPVEFYHQVGYPVFVTVSDTVRP